jgi:TonB family protein
MRRRNQRRTLLKGFLGLSILLHANLVLLVVVVVSLNPDGCATTDLDLDPFEVALVPEDEVPEEEQLKLDKEELEEEEKKEQEQDKDVDGQVVELPKPLEEQRPDKAKFLSEYDSKVKKQTKAPPQPFKAGRLVADRPPPRPPRTPPPSPKEIEKVERKVLKLAMRTRPDVPSSELEPSQKEDPDEPAKVKPVPQKVPKGPPSPRQQESAPQKKVTLQDLQLSEEELLKALGSRVNDYLKGVEQGKQTALNSKRWRFASFFNRVKRRVAQNWHPDVVYRRRDPTGNVYGFRDRLTILRVRLTPAGHLKEVHLERASGVGFLDDEAVAAFRAAGPFPNPPQGLVDQDTGLISFRFGFMFEISRRPSFRIFRNR